MASHASRPAPRARIRRCVALAIAVGGCSFAFGSLPVSFAQAAHTKASANASPVEAPPPPQPPPSKRAERATAPEGEACCAVIAPAGPPPPAEAPEAPAVNVKRHSPPPARPGRAGGGEAPAGAPSGSGAGASGGRNAAPTSPQASSPSLAAAGQSGEEATPSAKKGSGGKKEKGKEKEKEKTKEKGKGTGKGGKGKEAETPEEGQETTTPAESQAPTSVQKTGHSGETHGQASDADEEAVEAEDESTEAAPSGAVATIASDGASSTSSSLPPRVRKVGAVSVAGTRKARRARRAAVAAGVPAAIAVAGPTTLLAADTTTGAAGGGGSGSGGSARPAARPRRASSQPALEKTITRIVGVVPMAVWLLVAGLIALALALAVRSRLSSRRNRWLERQRGQLLEDVGVLQAALLPVPPNRLGPVGTTVAYRPADGPGAGGDFYDVFALEDGQLGVIVGDVSGHGREALPHTALLRYTVRAYLEAGLSPSSALQTAGAVLERQLGDSFATVVAATYHPRERALTYASAGHPPPLVIGSPDAPAPRSIVPVTACSAPPVGAGMPTGTRQTVVSIPGSAQLCFHTDGVTEARVGSDLYGARRLASALAGVGRGASAADVLERVVAETDARPDDMAACLLAIEGDAHAPKIVHEELEISAHEGASGRVELFLLACGVQPAEVAELMAAVRTCAERREAVVLDVRFDDGPPVVSLRHDNVIRAASLAAASAS